MFGGAAEEVERHGFPVFAGAVPSISGWLLVDGLQELYLLALPFPGVLVLRELQAAHFVLDEVHRLLLEYLGDVGEVLLPLR